MNSSTLPLTSEQDFGRWSKPCLGCFTTEKEPITIIQEADCVAGKLWSGAESFHFSGIRFPDLPARSESLHLLHHPGPFSKLII
jgi:hypothetical protein